MAEPTSERTIQLNERVSGLGQELKALAIDVRELDRRLFRVETALELASTGRFSSLPPADDDKADDDGR